jgi:hypothetical protein
MGTPVGLGGLAQGLAEGMNMGMQWRNQNKYLDMQQQHQDRMAKADDRDAEVHELRKDQYASEKDIRDRRQRAFAQIADFTAQALGGNTPNAAPVAPANMQDPNAPSFGAPPAQQTPSNIQLAGPIPQGGLSMNAPAAPYAGDNPAGALAPTPQPVQPPAEKPSKVLEKGMVTGAYTPEMLTGIANIFAQNGLHEEGIKYMEQAYTTQKRGGAQAAMAFMQNNPGAAMEALQGGGVQLEGMPVKVKPDDPSDHNWKINIAGQGEKTVNVKDWLQSTMDPEKFFEVEDKKRKATLDERKQSNDDLKTRAEVGYLKSRSSLADANADKAERHVPGGAGGLQPSRSSEAQINTAINRRDKAFDRVSSVKNEEGKFEVDPQKRQGLDSAANQYLTFLEDQRGEELDAREHHKFTDVMLTFPVGGTPAQVKQWQQKQFLPRFGGKAAQEDPGNAPARPMPQSGAPAQGLAPAAQSAPQAGTLSALQIRQKGVAALNSEMAGIQQALKSPNLNVEQKKALSLKAQEIATRRDALK